MTPLQNSLQVWPWLAALVFGLTAKTIENKDWWRTIATRRGRKLGEKKSKFFV